MYIDGCHFIEDLTGRKSECLPILLELKMNQTASSASQCLPMGWQYSREEKHVCKLLRDLAVFKVRGCDQLE